MTGLGDRVAGMGAAARLGLFAVVLAASFGTAAAVGAAVGPIDVGGSPDGEMHDGPHDTVPNTDQGNTDHDSTGHDSTEGDGHGDG